MSVKWHSRKCHSRGGATDGTRGMLVWMALGDGAAAELQTIADGGHPAILGSSSTRGSAQDADRALSQSAALVCGFQRQFLWKPVAVAAAVAGD